MTIATVLFASLVLLTLIGPHAARGPAVALMDIVMAVPIVVFQDRDVIAIADHPFGGWPGLVVAALILWGVYRVATRR